VVSYPAEAHVCPLTALPAEDSTVHALSAYTLVVDATEPVVHTALR
jgi:hypothetical protein